MQMTPMITAGDTNSVFALLQLITDPEATKKALTAIKEAQDKLASEAETVRQNRVDAEKAQKASQELLDEVDQKLTALGIREKSLTEQTVAYQQFVTKAREDAAAILAQAKLEETAIREAAEKFANADFVRSVAVSDALRLMKEQTREAEARLANANAALDALRAKVTS